MSQWKSTLYSVQPLPLPLGLSKAQYDLRVDNCKLNGAILGNQAFDSQRHFQHSTNMSDVSFWKHQTVSKKHRKPLPVAYVWCQSKHNLTNTKYPLYSRCDGFMRKGWYCRVLFGLRTTANRDLLTRQTVLTLFTARYKQTAGSFPSSHSRYTVKVSPITSEYSQRKQISIRIHALVYLK